MSFQIVGYDAYVLNMGTRMPFRYGIATLTAAPHLFLRAELEIDGHRIRGVAADHLPPKWFTKDPNSPYRQDVNDMVRVIRRACDTAAALPPASTVFELWKQLYAAQAKWADSQRLPPLLANFGVSLVERAMIDAFCRAGNITFSEALRQNRFGIEEIDLSLLPTKPLRTIIARHTVGLGDPLTEADIPPEEQVHDGLPQSLEACIRTYGLTHFKIKLSGDVAKDSARLRRLSEILAGQTRQYAFTLDGNENFHDIEPFRALWESLASDATLADFLSKLIFIEQPLHRDMALGDHVKRAMLAWHDRPPIIIDESDATLDSLPAALACGYVGTSHKNCKGVFKGITNACRIAQLRRDLPDKPHLLSGEDLSNVAPVALMQDLAVMASLGITHVERNGHHYFKGLTMLPEDLQAAVQGTHSDLFQPRDLGFPTLDVRGGKIRIGSVVDAPFGVGFDFDPSRFTPLTEWRFESLP